MHNIDTGHDERQRTSVQFLNLRKANASQESLASQFDLSRRLACLESSLRNTNRAPVSKFNLLFNLRMRTWAVVWDANACEGAGAKVVTALGC